MLHRQGWDAGSGSTLLLRQAVKDVAREEAAKVTDEVGRLAALAMVC